jgi:hypothetical protein
MVKCLLSKLKALNSKFLYQKVQCIKWKGQRQDIKVVYNSILSNFGD